jgi:adenylyl- and sulfurtransferase ThiI
MAKAQKYTVALLPSNPAVALSYIADRLGKSEFVKSTSIWGGCILVESTSPVEFAERCKRITGLDIIAVGSIVKGFNNAAIQLKQTAVKAVQHGESYRVSVIRHSFNTFQEDEEESMHLTGIIIDEMKKKGSVPRDKDAEFILRILANKQEYFVPKLSYQGIGGLPAGINGKAVCLISGGIGSVVAGMEIAKAGFIPLPLLVLNFVDEDEFRRAIISSCFLTELVLDRDMELKLVTLESDESIKSTYEESLKAGESEAKRIGTDYICTGIHVSAELPKLLEVCKRSSCKVINPVLTWDRQRLMSSVPEELRRRYIYERRGKVSRVVGKEKVISVALTDLAHYNEALDTAIKNLKE